MSNDVTYASDPVLDAESAAQVRQLVARAEQQDGAAPNSEHQLQRLGGTATDVPWRHITARSADGTVVAYAIVDLAGDTPEAEIVVDPAHRRSGFGEGLLGAVRELTGSRDTLVWSHGTTDGSELFAAGQHAEATRILWQLRRPAGPLPDAPLPDGISIRPFRTTDEQRWLEVNTAAFHSHPEQGSWTLEDLRAREAEPWFDPNGFLIAEVGDAAAGKLAAGDMAGFHWTKIHGPSTADLAADPNAISGALGEVYVVGVDPRAQGLGLGRALTIAGVRHLQDRGVPEVLLYVDDTNTPAITLYRDLGFTEYSRDTQYRLS